MEPIETHDNKVYGITHKAQAAIRSKPKEISRNLGDLSRKPHIKANEDSIETTPNVVYGMNTAESSALT